MFTARARYMYFVHQFSPAEEEDSILHPEHADVKAAVAATDAQVAALARVLNTPSVGNGVTVASSSAHAALNVLLKRSGGCTFLLAVNDGLPQNQTPAPIPWRRRACSAAAARLAWSRRPRTAAP